MHLVSTLKEFKVDKNQMKMCHSEPPDSTAGFRIWISIQDSDPGLKPFRNAGSESVYNEYGSAIQVMSKVSKIK
jgi:hypothetical protein